MRLRSWTNVSLAAKCRILFGAAVLLILAAALYLPWVRMDSLTATADVQRAQQVALVARVTGNIDFQDWEAAKSQLVRDWPASARPLNLSINPPDLISIEQEPGFRSRRPEGFIAESFRRFRQDPTVQYVHKFQEDDGRHFLRLAMAVRRSETDPEPNKLRGIIHLSMPVEPENWYWSLIVLMFAGLCGSFLAMLVFYLVTQKLILSPVRKLRAAADQVTEGDTDVRAHIDTGDEFEKLADAFNDMLERIKKSHDELRTINRSLDVKLEELAATNVTLYESNRLKSDFIANVSHELRTPLGLIINFAELLRDALEDPPEDTSRVKRYAVNILQNGRTLLDLINDLLDLAKIEAGRVDIHITECPVAETCLALIDFVKPLADKKNIELVGPSGDALPLMRSDAGKVKQILYNLLSNAIKFTPEGGTVRLDVGMHDADHVRMSVADTGPGISEELYGTIFEKFRQIDSSLTKEHSGTGLGLAITKELVQMLGGTIKVASRLGEGSTFTVVLPLTAPQSTQQRLVALND